MKRKWTILAALVALAAIAVATLFLMRSYTMKSAYDRAAAKLASRLDPSVRERFEADYTYTLETFWKFYQKDLVSRNDLNDVMDRMKQLSSQREVSQSDVFNFLGFVSGIYTRAQDRSLERRIEEQQSD